MRRSDFSDEAYNPKQKDGGVQDRREKGPPHEHPLNSLRLSLPVAVFGSASTNSIARGYLYGAICALAWACSSATNASDASASALSTTKAFTFCPRSGHGTPITALPRARRAR